MLGCMAASKSAQSCAQLGVEQHTTWMPLHHAKLQWSRHVSVKLMLYIMLGAPTIAMLSEPVQRTKILATYGTGC